MIGRHFHANMKVQTASVWLKFLGGGEGWWMGKGVAVKDTWSGVVGGGGVIKGSFQNVLKQGVGKGKSCSLGGGGFEGVTTPAPPRKILIIHQRAKITITQKVEQLHAWNLK